MGDKWDTASARLCFVGDGVGLSAQPGFGRIITLVPDKTQASFRLSDQVLDELQRLADRLGKSRPDVLELAVTHLSGTLEHNQPVFIGPPPKPPASHKRVRRAS